VKSKYTGIRMPIDTRQKLDEAAGRNKDVCDRQTTIRMPSKIYDLIENEAIKQHRSIPSLIKHHLFLLYAPELRAPAE